MQTPRTSSPRTTTSRALKALVASSIVLAGLSLGAGAAGAFPNGPGIIQDDPIPPLPPQNPQDFAAAPVDPPAPQPGPNGNGTGTGTGTGGQDLEADAGPTAEGLAVIAGLAQDQAVAEAADAVEVDGTVGKESDRPAQDDEVIELAAGTDVSAESASSLPALLAGLIALLVAGAAALWLFVAKRRQDGDDTVAA